MNPLDHIFQAIRVPILVPSLQTIESFAPINASQLLHLQKIAYETNDPLSPVFYEEALQIIKDNAPNNLNVSSLTTWDIEYILQTYYNNIYKPGVVLSQIIVPSPIEYCWNNLKMTVDIPSINRQLIADRWLFNILNQENITDIEDIVDICLNKSLLVEFSKYIVNIDIDGSIILFDTLTVEESIKVVQTLPATLFETLLTQIGVWNNQLKIIFPTKFGPWLFT